MDLKFQVQLKIQRPVAEVFDGVVNPAKLNGYFVQKASGPLREGTTVQWTFAEVPGDHDVVVRTGRGQREDRVRVGGGRGRLQHHRRDAASRRSTRRRRWCGSASRAGARRRPA